MIADEFQGSSRVPQGSQKIGGVVLASGRALINNFLVCIGYGSSVVTVSRD